MNDAFRCKKNCTNACGFLARLGLALFQGLDFRPVTVSAGGRGGCVKQHWLAVYRPDELMAARARDVAVLAFQGEFGPLVVIE